MRSKRFRVVLTALLVALPLAACGEGGGGGGEEEKKAEKIVTVGVKFDQPGLGMKNPDGSMTGFDIDTATFVAEQLGYNADEIVWKEAPSLQRENLIQTGQVDYIVATYSITPERKQKVDFAGPYFQTGQSLLVRADNTDIVGPESLQKNKAIKLCSVAGSTPAQRIKIEYPGIQLQLYDTYSACVEALTNRAIDAVTTDAVILAGYAAQNPRAMKVVGQPFSTELYGIGLTKDNNELRAKINDAIQKMIDEGQWQAAFEKNIGRSGYPMPALPQIDRN